MAQYTVDHACGHSQTHQLYGKHADRDRKIEWLETTVCSDCYRAEQEKSRAADSAAAAENNAAAGLPALVGSEKQIAWAESIRSKFLTELAKVAEPLKSNPNLSAAAQLEIADMIALLLAEPREIAAARWWIDNRDTSPRTYFQKQVIDRRNMLCPTAVAELDAMKEVRNG